MHKSSVNWLVGSIIAGCFVTAFSGCGKKEAETPPVTSSTTVAQPANPTNSQATPAGTIGGIPKAQLEQENPKNPGVK